MTAVADSPQPASQTDQATYEPDRVFAPLHDESWAKPIVIAQLGQTLDGRIATITGESRGIGGEAGLYHLHLLRAHVDAVIVGAGTIEMDDPRLNVRLNDGVSPARVVLDPSGRIGENGKWLAADGVKRILVSRRAHKPAACDELIQIDAQDGNMPPKAIVAELFKRGYRKILVEGGPKTLSRFLSANAVDRLHIVVSPVIFGSGPTGLDPPPIRSMTQALRPRTKAYILSDGEVLFDCDLRSH